MKPLILLAAVPLALIAGCLYLLILIAVACGLARFARWARLRVTLLRRGRIPADGTPLRPDEAYKLAGIERGLKQEPEPAPNHYQNPGWPP